MHLRHLRLLDFRSWPLLELDLGPGVTTLVGRNGHGKTNVLEAVTVLATLSSHRVSSDAPLLRRGSDTALLTALAHNAGRELTVELALNSGKANRARLNTSPCRRVSDVLGVVQSILFAPEDLALVRGEPAERRGFLDALAVQRRPLLAGVRSDYAAALRQRSALLKSASGALRRGQGADAALSTLEVWDSRIAALGAQTIAARVSLLAELRPHVVEAYRSLAPESRPAALSYRFRVADSPPEAELVDSELVEVTLLSELARRRREEIDRGMSLVGPHRDDVDLLLGDEPAKGFASHGETWSYALSLRLGSFGLLRADGCEPVLLLDDVFAELDRHRRSALAGVAAGVEQVLVTAAVGEDVPASLRGVRHNVVMTGDGDDRRSVMTASSPVSSAAGDSAEPEPVTVVQEADEDPEEEL